MNKPIDPKGHTDLQTILAAANDSTFIRHRGLKWVAIAVSAILLLALLWYLGGKSNNVSYVTEPVTRGNLTVIVTATGSVQPTKKVDVSSESWTW